MTVRLLPLVPMLMIAGCAAVPPARPPVRPTPIAKAPPAATPVQDWKDRPYSAGTWRYLPSATRPSASFGTVAGNVAILTCDRAAQRLVWWIGGGQAGTLTIRTTYGARAIATMAATGGATASLAATDPLLDQIVFSRGRFALAATGAAELVMPAWAEPARVVEDCRG